MEYLPANKVPIYSINYDFMPTIPYSQKVLWVQLRYPAPPSLRVGNMVQIISTDQNFTPPSDILQVIDIIGTRVALSSRYDNICSPAPCPPFSPGRKREGSWHPWSHSYGTWGYETRDVSDSPYAYRSWLYGNGRSVSYLVW